MNEDQQQELTIANQQQQKEDDDSEERWEKERKRRQETRAISKPPTPHASIIIDHELQSTSTTAPPEPIEVPQLLLPSNTSPGTNDRCDSLTKSYQNVYRKNGN